MVDQNKVLFREGAREEYWYRQGFLEGYKSAKQMYGARFVNVGADDYMQHGMEQTARNAKAQIAEDPIKY